MIRFERTTTRPPDVYSNLAELHPEKSDAKVVFFYKTAKVILQWIYISIFAQEKLLLNQYNRIQNGDLHHRIINTSYPHFMFFCHSHMRMHSIFYNKNGSKNIQREDIIGASF